jgi:hypothetical protein
LTAAPQACFEPQLAVDPVGPQVIYARPAAVGGSAQRTAEERLGPCLRRKEQGQWARIWVFWIV